MKKLMSLIVILSLMLCIPFSADAETVSCSAGAYVLYCADNDEVLLSGDPDLRLPMASTTKIMTALITVEIADKENRVVEFTDEMTAEGSSMYLKVGEQVRFYDLAVGMMMQSGNDAANAAAIAIAGSTERFADRMNRKAAEIGMENTHFVTPSGLDDEAHYSTARDMAKLMAYALRNDSFRKLTAQKSVTVNFVKPAEKQVTYPNHNRLLSLYDGCIGGKTGYTMTAGRCLVTAAKRDGMTLIAVTLDDRDDWDDHAALYDYGFSNYAALRTDRETYRTAVVGGTEDEVAVLTAQNKAIIVPADSLDRVESTVQLPPFLYAPVTGNSAVGEIVYTLDGKEIGKLPLIAVDDIAYFSRKRGFFEYIADVLNL